MGKKVLITGCGGFVGPYMVDLAVEKGYEVTATALRKPEYLKNGRYGGVKFEHSDLRDKKSLEKVVNGNERVYHIGALFDFFAGKKDLFRINVGGTDNLCQVAKDNGVKEFINWSSGAIYGKGNGNKLMKETDPPLPTDNYARSKWEAECVAFRHNGNNGFRVISLRAGAIYGPGSRYGDASALYLLKKGLLFAVPGFTEPLSSHAHVRDVVMAAHYLSERKESYRQSATDPADIAFNICDDSPARSSDLLNTASSLLKDKGLLGFFNFRIPATPVKIAAYLAEAWAKITRTKPLFEVDSIDYISRGRAIDNEKLRGTGYRLLYPDILASLKETIGWYEKTNWEVFNNKGKSMLTGLEAE
ncbi:MAG: NAD(P)-dependent oxidoreductase [Deltaproteobacteria bacterium]|nr:MAG: NAD(P)-dependent oxidoreductase [Deltaproteobacteria bacterium]